MEILLKNAKFNNFGRVNIGDFVYIGNNSFTGCDNRK